MAKPTALTKTVTKTLIQMLDGEPDAQKLNSALRYLGKWRAQLMENTLLRNSGDEVLSGPFEGMKYDVRATEGSKCARLIGCYEKGLRDIIDDIVKRRYKLIIDLGCAEGYYAVGIACRKKSAKIMARDANPNAQASCAALAKSNGVEDIVEVGGEMTHKDFDICKKQKTAIICDIEGEEEALLDPKKAKGLLSADILVEVHENIKPGLVDKLIKRFEKTHKITRIDRQVSDEQLPDWLNSYSDMDRLIAIWEWRGGNTPWLWMEQK